VKTHVALQNVTKYICIGYIGHVFCLKALDANISS